MVPRSRRTANAPVPPWCLFDQRRCLSYLCFVSRVRRRRRSIALYRAVRMTRRGEVRNAAGVPLIDSSRKASCAASSARRNLPPAASGWRRSALLSPITEAIAWSTSGFVFGAIPDIKIFSKMSIWAIAVRLTQGTNRGKPDPSG